jgi:hypothetical protein
MNFDGNRNGNGNDEGEVDLSRFEVKTTILDPKPERKSRRLPLADYRFQRLPNYWINKLTKARCISTFKLAHLLLTLDWESRGKPIELGNDRLHEAKLSHDAKLDALTELEELGLVQVEHRPFKSPVVTLIKKVVTTAGS